MTIYVDNLSYLVTEDDLKELFQQYGFVRRVQLPADRETGRVRGFAFVEMESDAQEQDAIDALNGAEFMGRDLGVKKAKPKEERGGRGGYGGGGGGYSRY